MTGAASRRPLILAGAGAGLIALVLLASLLAGGGGGGGGGDTAAPPVTVPRSTTTTAVPLGDLETFELFTTKNPFTPLVGTAPGVAPPTGGAPTPGGTTAGGPTSGGTTGGTTGGGTTATTGTGSGGGAEPRRSQRVALVSVFSESGRTRASVRVNDTVYRVGEGDTFASSFRVLSLDGTTQCGRFLFGDDPFRLCEGDEVLK